MSRETTDARRPSAVIRRGATAAVPAVVALVVALAVFLAAPGFTVVFVLLALPLSAVSAIATVVLMSRFGAWCEAARTVRAARARVAVVLGAAWILALLAAPALTILSGPLQLWLLTSLFDVTTSASGAPQFETYPSMLGFTVPLAAFGMLAALLVLPGAVRAAPRVERRPE